MTKEKKKEKQTFENVAYTKIWIILSFFIVSYFFRVWKTYYKKFLERKTNF